MYGIGLIKGLIVTFRHFCGTIVYDIRRLLRRSADEEVPPTRGEPTLHGIFSIQYPEQKVPMWPRFRGPLMQLRDPETGDIKCTACGMCVRACPHGCITCEGKGKGKERRPTVYLYDVGRCIFCRQCVESCPFDAIELSREYELACYEKDTIWDLERLLELGDRETITEAGQYWK